MTTREALKKYNKLEIELLLAHVLKKPKEFLYMNPKYELSSYQVQKLSSLVKRRMGGEPIAYILGYKDFFGLRFKVNKNVLIPRPETEWLVEEVVSSIKYKVLSGHKIQILDVGTGSGCVVISIAKQLKELQIPNYKFRITASDVSKKALDMAKANARNHKVKIKFIQSDLLKNIKGKLDIIVANLPYVRRVDYHKLKKGLSFEPKLALTDGTNQWKIYERFFKEVGQHLKPSGVILLEIDPKSKHRLSSLAKRHLPGSKLKFHKDFNNFWRYMEIKN